MLKRNLIAVALCLFINQFVFGQGKDFNLSGQIEQTLQEDTIILRIWEHVLNYNFRFSQPYIEYSQALEKDGIFSFKHANLGKISYFSLSLQNKQRKILNNRELELFKMFIAEPGDIINVRISELRMQPTFNKTGQHNDYPMKMSVVFTGNHADKLYAKYRTDTLLRKLEKNMITTSKDTVINPFPYPDLPRPLYKGKFRTWIKNQDQIYSMNNTKLALLDSILNLYKPGISPDVYGIIRADIIGELMWRLYEVVGAKLSRADREKLTIASQDSILAEKKELYKTKLRDLHQFNLSDYALRNSYSISKMLAARATCEALLNNNNESTYAAIKKLYAGELKDRVLLEHFLENANSLQRQDSLFSDAIKEVQTGYVANLLVKLVDLNANGRPAYNFSLTDVNGNKVKLSDFKGKFVFMDFWYTGCGGCSQYYEAEVSKAEHYFKDSNVVFITVCVDSDMDKWKKSIESGEYTTGKAKNVINLYTEGLSSTHPIIRNYFVKTYPKPLLIDRDGKILVNERGLLRGSINGESALIYTIRKEMENSSIVNQ